MGKQFLSILFGWLLGLLSSTIIDLAKSRRRKREILATLKIELEDLRFRLAISSLQMSQTRGLLNREFLTWILPIVETYEGNEPHTSVKKHLQDLAKLDEQSLSSFVTQTRGSEDMGMSLKSFQSSFLESHLAEISKMPVSLQRKIHEFRNHLSMLNQETAKTEDYMKMSFNKSLGEENLKRIHTEINSKYDFIQQRCKIAATRLSSILAEI